MRAIDDAPFARRAPFGHPVVGDRGTDTRRRILAATMEALADVGFDAVRVEVIADRAGCSRPSFYQYFASKHDVFWALASTLGEEILALASRLETVAPNAAGVAHLEAWIGEFMTLHETWEPVFSSFQAASRDHLPAARRLGISLRTDEALLHAFGLTGEGISERLMGAMVALLDRSSHYAERAPAVIDRRPFVEALAELFHRVFFGPREGINVDRSRRPRRRRVKVEPLRPASDIVLPPRQEHARQRLLTAGRQVLPARGYHDTRVDDIVGAAGVSHGSFYRYFSGKDAFFLVLAEGSARRAIDLMGKLDADASVADLRGWVTDWMHTYRADGGIISTWQEMRTDATLSRFSTEVAAAMFDRLVVVLEQRGFGAPEADATSLLALLERLPNNVYTLGFTSEEDGVQIMTTILRRGYFAIED